MPNEPAIKRTIAFFDGQNLYHSAKEAFGYSTPNYDPKKLADDCCKKLGWALAETRFYTGVPDIGDNEYWHTFWTSKLAAMGRQGIQVISRPLAYRNERITLQDGTQKTIAVGSEKGIDIRLATDVIQSARDNKFNVGLIFSQDQDMAEVVREVRDISISQDRWIQVASAFPVSPTARSRRGIDGAYWVHINRKSYDACIDSNDYRPKRKRKP